MPDFAIPLSGLTASETALSVISNNLANMNTTGYKDTAVSFQDLFYQNIGSTGAGDPEQVGAGVAIGTLSTNFNGGDLQTTSVNTDVAISNNGFFVVQGSNGQNLYTRNGEFTVNPAGFLVNNEGDQVLGYTATNGVVNTSQALGPLQLGSGQINPPNPTSSIELNTNLNAGSNVGDSYSTSIDVYDSLGDSHVVNVQFTKNDTNTWGYQMTVPGADVGAASAETISSGSLTFNQSGALTSWTDASGNSNAVTTNVTGITIPGLVDGATPLTFSWNLTNNGAPTLTQMAAASSTPSTQQDGFSSGTLNDFSIDPNGMIEGSFTNGTKVLGQIALAGFSNEEGLSRQGDGSFAATLASGQAAIGAPGTGGLGTLNGGSLEGSNVDISQEFSNLIMAQRQFEANAKSITTFDEVTQATINLKH